MAIDPHARDIHVPLDDFHPEFGPRLVPFRTHQADLLRPEEWERRDPVTEPQHLTKNHSMSAESEPIVIIWLKRFRLREGYKSDGISIDGRNCFGKVVLSSSDHC
jgi:hypothetical protein